MAIELSNFQKERKAKTIIERLRLSEDLNDLNQKLRKLFNDAPVHVVETISKEEMKHLISEIKKGTKDNDKISRFLEMAQKLGLS